MNKKLLTIALTAVISLYSLAAYAETKGKNDDMPVKQQVQTANQGEDSQLNVQTQEQMIPQPVTTSVRMDGKEDGVEVKNQNQVKNQGEDNQIKTQEEQGEMKGDNGENEKSDSAMGEQKRSDVANAVQAMLQVADKVGGLGEQVRVIAQNQNQNQEKLDSSMKKVESRGAIAKFFFGADYSEIKKAEAVLEQSHQQIEELNQLINQVTNQADQQALTEQIQVLEKANTAASDTLSVAQKGFSLLGWMFKWLAK